MEDIYFTDNEDDEEVGYPYYRLPSEIMDVVVKQFSDMVDEEIKQFLRSSPTDNHSINQSDNLDGNNNVKK